MPAEICEKAVTFPIAQDTIDKSNLMGTYTQIIYQIVFGTKNRHNCMIKESRDIVFTYMTGILRNHKCVPYIVNGVGNHVHILTHLHPSISLSDLVKSVKMSSHAFIDENHLFPNFTSWQRGYSAFTYSKEALPNLKRYIANQEIHHQTKKYEEELIGLLKKHGVNYDEKYVFE